MQEISQMSKFMLNFMFNHPLNMRFMFSVYIKAKFEKLIQSYVIYSMIRIPLCINSWRKLSQYYHPKRIKKKIYTIITHNNVELPAFL